MSWSTTAPTTPTRQATPAPAPLVLHTALAAQPVLARLSSSATTVPSGTPFVLEAVAGAQQGVATLSSRSITVTAAHLGWNQLDISHLFKGTGVLVTGSADDTVVSARLDVAGTLLSPGSYLVELAVSSSAGSDSDALTIVVT